MTKESPLQTVKRLYGSKDKLVDSIADYARDDDEDKNEAIERLKSLSNRKLLRMASISERVKELGGRDELAAAVAATEGRDKDSDYTAKLRTYTPAMLVDRLDSAKRRARKAS